MGTDFPRMNTDNGGSIRPWEGCRAIQFRVHPWEIRAHPCSSQVIEQEPAKPASTPRKA